MAQTKGQGGKKLKEQEVLLTFLKRTKKGEYAPIDESSLAYARMEEEVETIVLDEEYYYSMN